MDFYRIVINEKKDGTLQLRPDWKVGRSKDLMTRGGSFYAVWDEERGLWSTDIYDVQRLVDADLIRYANEAETKTGVTYKVSRLESHGSRLWSEFHTFLKNSGNNSHNLDEKLIFANTDVKKEDYASKRLAYSLVEGPCPAWDTIVGTLYSDEERAKIEWAIGAVVSGDSTIIQKFLVFYGPPGSGKSTILNIIERLFAGYTAVFDARELAGSSNAFATSAFKTNPLVGIQHDGDLSRIYDNTKLNSIVAHEILPVNEKYKAPYTMRANTFLFMGTNVPVKITDAKSGIIRRLIDVVPTQRTFDPDTYHNLMDRIEFELGAIANKCFKRYSSMGKNYYSTYRPTEMMLQTDVFFNFIEYHYDIFNGEDGITLKRAWILYKEYCAETGIEKTMPQYKLREELKNYFHEFEERARVDGVSVRSYYKGFKYQPPTPMPEFPIKPDGMYEIEFEEGPSIFDELYPGLPAQYAKEDPEQGWIPERPWSEVATTLSDLDTEQLHFVKIPESHIVIDFDLIDDNGDKDFARNLEEASKWPATYAEISQGGNGIHLHYIYNGDVRELKNVYDVGIEVKTLLGNASLRRRLRKSNHVNITPLDGGLPKKEKKVLSDQSIKSEKGLRDLIVRNLRKEIHAGTKPSVDFIHHILEEAYESGMAYDLLDMRGAVLTFAAKSTNHSAYCINRVQKMQFVGENRMEETKIGDDTPLVFFDVEVYPNLLVVCWKTQGSDTVVRMINPEAHEVEALFSKKLVGFNCRRYDNHIIYARYLGWSLEQIFNLSQKIINEKNKEVLFGEAYNISYTDVYDFSSKKASLKRFMIDLDLHHMELDIPWDKPVPQELWDRVAEYCCNDVLGTEEVFESRKQDFVARQILASLSGLSVNHTTQQHTAKIIFGEDRSPQNSFVYTDLSLEFPGYYYGPIIHPETGETRWGSLYREEDPGEGGYVYAEPGIYENVALLDVASMHPTSIERLNLFGRTYTEKFSQLKEARLAIKRKDYNSAREMLEGKLGQFLGDDQDAEALAYALKIVINIVYGLTSARFANPFRDNRNKDNIVAKRGALFMIELKRELQNMGWTVAHIKTDSIKIPNATPEVIKFVIQFGEEYGYEFEHETTYDWLCLVNHAVYIARKTIQEDTGCREEWTAVGAQFQHPYIYKTLLTHEETDFGDFCETKQVQQGTMYLDFTGTGELEHMVHVGRSGSFVPVMNDGGDLWRVKDDKKYAVTGTKGYRWITRDAAIDRGTKGELHVDMQYFQDLEQDALNAISKFNEVSDLDGLKVLATA